MALAVALGTLALGIAGCGGDSSKPSAAQALPAKPTCPVAWRAGWQKLANEIRAPVYCPSWLPQPLEGRFGGPFFNGRAVDPDRSYLVSFVWFESGGGVVNEVHVNLRGYPGKSRIPTCEDTLTVEGRRCTRTSPASAIASGRSGWAG